MKKNIKELIAYWEKEAVINPDQASRMRTDIDLDSSQRSKSRFISILSTLGAIILATGIILFISSNWSYIPQLTKLVSAIALPVIPISFSYYLIHIKQSHVLLGRAALFVGLMLIGGALAIIGQVYNLESEYVRFFAIWTLLTTPFVYLFKRTESVAVLVVLIGAFFTAILFEIFVYDIWVNSTEEYTALILFSFIYILYGIFIYYIGKRIKNTPVWKQSSRFLQVIGVKLVLFVGFLMTFEFYTEMLQDIGLDLFAGGTRLVLNLIYIGLLVYVLHRSIKSETQSLISVVFFWSGLFILMRYFDFFWDMLPTSLFFIVGGVIFIAGAIFLDKQRRKLVAGFDTSSVVNSIDYEQK